MNTFRDNLEHQIKKQIEEREIAPSRDLWSEIEVQKGTAHSKFRMNWVLAAACVVLVFGLGFVLFSNPSGEKNIQKTEIAKVKNTSPQEKGTEKNNENVVSEPVYVEKKVIQENKVTPINAIEKTLQAPILAEQMEKAPQKEEVQMIVPEISKIPAPANKVMAQSEEASKSPVKKKKYVDPATLLFSVEHKDIIEKTKESNVATIDLNGK
ncbi:hypothetical protein [Chryseobacterium gwangjuense]|uniref:hypothetical protein n=1 Tax=Chryseobacterium gwangjuense TaxID=1069980 RepID=UPI001E5D5986|nr:hypothetical protein [Chryseobacterium gwangjuense]MCE3074985.1 hypothetical protein [Chryseobacterium gwangjuense]